MQANPTRRCQLHSRVGSDLYGDLVAGKIKEAGVELSAARRGGQGVCICLSGERDRSFVSYKGTVGEFNEDDLNLRRLFAKGTSHVHFSAYYDCAALQPAVPQLVARARSERGATVSIVPQADSAGEWRAGLVELLPLVDVLLCNQREAAAIAGVQYAGRRPTRGPSPNPQPNPSPNLTPTLNLTLTLTLTLALTLALTLTLTPCGQAALTLTPTPCGQAALTLTLALTLTRRVPAGRSLSSGTMIGP